MRNETETFLLLNSYYNDNYVKIILFILHTYLMTRQLNIKNFYALHKFMQIYS